MIPLIAPITRKSSSLALRPMPGESGKRSRINRFAARKRIIDSARKPSKRPRRLARCKDAGRSLRTVERERFPRAGARHLRSRAAPA
jgi:hypothetical protein